jgi:hypothetical protein
MYQVPPPKEPNGCLQTLVISRIIAQILLVPMLLIIGGIAGVVIALYAFTTNPLLGVGFILLVMGTLTALASWEYRRVKRDLPPMDERDRIDPRMR